MKLLGLTNWNLLLSKLLWMLNTNDLGPTSIVTMFWISLDVILMILIRTCNINFLLGMITNCGRIVVDTSVHTLIRT